jgi:hypothetical protein
MSQVQNHLLKGVFPQLHEELNRITTGPTTKAVIELFLGTDMKTGFFVVMKGAQAHQSSALRSQHHPGGNHIHNIHLLAHLFNGVRVQTECIHPLGKKWPFFFILSSSPGIP